MDIVVAIVSVAINLYLTWKWRRSSQQPDDGDPPRIGF